MAVPLKGQASDPALRELQSWSGLRRRKPKRLCSKPQRTTRQSLSAKKRLVRKVLRMPRRKAKRKRGPDSIPSQLPKLCRTLAIRVKCRMLLTVDSVLRPGTAWYT